MESRRAGVTRWQILLGQTDFHPGSTGMLQAVAPSGATLQVPVLDVQEDAGELWHIAEKPLAAGTRVTGMVAQG
ncbi:MAG: hypothetical protein KGK08_00760 [Acidobacteriota bacterium]|nr:hypothetical protein [Acidobacteriota bacterium]